MCVCVHAWNSIHLRCARARNDYNLLNYDRMRTRCARIAIYNLMTHSRKHTHTTQTLAETTGIIIAHRAGLCVCERH